MPSADDKYIQEAQAQANPPKPPKHSASRHEQATSQAKPRNNPQHSRLEQDRFFIEAASDRRGAQLADAVVAASYRKAMHLLKLGYTGDLTQEAMQELADEWNSDDFHDIAMGETIDEGDLKTLALPSSTEKNYFALPSAKDKE